MNRRGNISKWIFDQSWEKPTWLNFLLSMTILKQKEKQKAVRIWPSQVWLPYPDKPKKASTTKGGSLFSSSYAELYLYFLIRAFCFEPWTVPLPLQPARPRLPRGTQEVPLRAASFLTWPGSQIPVAQDPGVSAAYKGLHTVHKVRGRISPLL